MSTVRQGSTIVLSATYRNGVGALVDPTSPEVEIRNPSNVISETGTPTRQSQGEFSYNFFVPLGAPVGSWISRFKGVVDSQLIFGDEVFSVLPVGAVDGGLITLAEYRTATGVDLTDTRNDARITQWIPWASQAIRSFTERDFGAPTVTEERVFEYDGSGYLDIDDASSVSAVTLAYPNSQDISLTVDDWAPKPERRDDAPVYQYLLMSPYSGGWGSPEMGFNRNLDVYTREHGGSWGSPSKVKVTAEWGWPDIPGDIKMAAIWTIQEWISRPSGEAVTSEAIEGWSRSWGGRGGTAAASFAIPQRARDILASYSKILT